MIIGMKRELKDIQMALKDNRPIEELEDLSIKGTLAVIEGPINFRITDGFIQFLKIVLNQVPITYGKQDPKWQKYLNKIYTTAEKLQDSQTKFTGKTKEEFQAYCKKLSRIMEKDTKPLTTISLDIATEDNLVAFMEKHVAKGHCSGFYYKSNENVHKELMNELMEQLSGIKFEKESALNYNISGYLTRSGYHEHVHDALNVILNTAVYAINCSSTKEQDAYSFDTQKIYNNLRYAEVIMNRTKYIILNNINDI